MIQWYTVIPADPQKQSQAERDVGNSKTGRLPQQSAVERKEKEKEREPTSLVASASQ